jgi:hypothetical protein
MEPVNHKLLIACIGKFEYMFHLIPLPDCSEIVVKLIKTNCGLSIGRRYNKKQKK